MVSWQAFAEAAPELSGLIRERFDATELVMLGTLRKDGSPRVTPIEYTYYGGDFTIGGMWQSMKMRDLLRDPRCTAHSATSNKNGQQGDAKLFGRAIPLAAEREEAYWDYIFSLLNWRPEGPAHVFTIDIESAAYIRFTPEGMMERLVWPGEGWTRTRPS